jgi:hypothetical protein
MAGCCRSLPLKNLRFLLVAVLILGFLALIPIPLAHAVPPTCTWDGSNSTWETASHWSCSTGLLHHVPASGDDATIPSGTVTVTVNENVGAGDISNSGTLIINTGVTLGHGAGVGDTINNVGGTITNMGTLSSGTGDINNGGTITNIGTITFTGGVGDLNNNGGTITNRGTISGSGTSEVINTGTVTNFGTITFVSVLVNRGTFTNCGGTFSFSAVQDNPVVNGGTVCAVTTTTAPPIPEYPIGLPILAILTIIAYGLIRRRTRK